MNVHDRAKVSKTSGGSSAKSSNCESCPIYADECGHKLLLPHMQRRKQPDRRMFTATHREDSVLTYPTKWACPKCLVLDEQDTEMIYDITVGRKVPHTRCRHCGFTKKKPCSVGVNGCKFKRGPHKPQIKCPKCGNLGTAVTWHGELGNFIYHYGVSKSERMHYVPVSQRKRVLDQLRVLELITA